MKDNFKKCVHLVLQSEGGFVNSKTDPGGITNFGITKLNWQKYVGKPVSIAEMQDITIKDAITFYKSEFWDAIKGDDIPLGIDYSVFDMAVHSGPQVSIKILQRCLIIPDDGIMGPKTLASLGYCRKLYVIDEFYEKRLKYVSLLKNYKENQNGWNARISRVLDESLTMLSHEKSTQGV